jgi:intracellular sulfur oxidation DsrE/DsrF family protein
MNQDKRFSDEFLNSFVDDQLAAEEKSRAYADIGNDEVVNRQVCELRKLHDLVQHAYRDVPPPPSHAHGRPGRRARLRVGMVACLMLAFGMLLGMLIELPTSVQAPQLADNHAAPVADPAGTAPRTLAWQRATRPTVAAASLAAPAAATADPLNYSAAAPAPTAPAAAAEVKNKVIIHIADNDAAQLSQALTEIEGLLRYYRDSRQSARVEVVMNGRGLDLVRTDTSAFAERIAQLQKNYGNLTFAACQNTIERMQQEQGLAVRLLPGVIVIDSGMAEIMRRQSQGWTYLQV